METPKSSKFRPLLAAVAGFLGGCIVMYFIWSQAAVTTTGSSGVTEYEQTVSASTLVLGTQTEKIEKLPGTGAGESTLRGAGARQALNEIKRSNVASVNVRFFATNDGKFSRQFMDFFEVSPEESARLFDLIKATNAEMWNAAKAQAQVSQTATGGVVVKIPPVGAGPDIYDKVMDGFHAVLGDSRFNDMMLYNGRQFENLFNHFGGENRTVTIEKSDGDRYNVNIETETRPGAKTSESATLNRDDIGKWKPGLEDFILGQ